LATPSYQESTNEKLIGANDAGYAVIRIESNNQGNYYRSQETIYLDEYNTADGQLIKTTLLIDRMITRDAGHNDPNTPASTGVKTIKKNDKIILADIYEKYRPLDSSYQPDFFKEFNYTENGILYGNNLLIHHSAIDKLYEVSFNHEKAKPKIMSIQSSGSSIFFKITTRRSEEGISNKIICLSPKKTKRVHAWTYLQPIYLQISSHPTLDGANKRAQEILQIAKEKKLSCRLEIWSKRLATDKMAYYIVYANSSSLIKRNKVELQNKTFNTIAIPISSSGFLDRWIPHRPGL
jgi:hypothetical protein